MAKAPSSDLDIVKRPHSKSNYTEGDLLELMRCINDPMYFMRKFVKVQHPMKGAIPFEPYPFQERLLNAFHEHRLTVALTARQMGKCVTSETNILRDDAKARIGDLVPLSLRERVVNRLENLLLRLAR